VPVKSGKNAVGSDKADIARIGKPSTLGSKNTGAKSTAGEGDGELTLDGFEDENATTAIEEDDAKAAAKTGDDNADADEVGFQPEDADGGEGDVESADEDATDEVENAAEDTQKNYPKKRNYSGLSSEEVAVAKKLPNEQFGLLRKKLDEISERDARIKEIESGALPASYYDNADAYVLDPGYREVLTQSHRMQYEAEHWENAKAAMRSGQSWVDLTWDKDGNPVRREIVPEKGSDGKPILNAKAEAYIDRRLMQAAAKQSQIEAQLGQIQQSFAGRHTALHNGMRQLREQLFPMYKGEFSAIKDPDVLSFWNAIPKEMRGHPLAELCSAGYGYCAKLVAELQKHKIATDNRRKTGLPASKIGNGKAPTTKMLSMADFE